MTAAVPEARLTEFRPAAKHRPLKLTPLEQKDQPMTAAVPEARLTEFRPAAKHRPLKLTRWNRKISP